MSFVRGGSTVLLYCPRPLTKLLRVKLLSASPLYSKELKSVLICASKSSVPDETADATVLATSISPSAPEALHNVDLSSYGFGGWLPTDLTPFLFELPYNYLQLPWWGAIATVALLVRLSLFPWALQNRIAGGRLAVVSERSIPINNKMEDAKRANDSYEISKASSELMRLYSEHKVSPFTAFKFPMMQGVAFLSVFWGLKSMIVQSVVGLKAGGALWFPNLLQPDPYGVLPVLSGLLLLTNIRCGGDGGTFKDNKFSLKFRFLLSIGSVAIIPLLWTFPSGLLIYVIANSSITLGQIVLFKCPPIRRYFKFMKDIN